MLQTIRDRATGWIAYTIVGFLIVPFALWGINSYFDGGAALNVAEVNGTEIPQQEFQRAYQQQRQRLQNLFGSNFDPAAFDETRLQQRVLQQLVDEQLVLQAAEQQGLRVGDQQLRQAILSSSAFQQEGVFNSELYRRVLSLQGYSEISFEEGLRNNLAAEQLQNGIVSSAPVTPQELDQLIRLLSEKRTLQTVKLPFSRYLEQTDVDDAAVETYFEANKERFMEPERVQLHYLDISVDQLAETIEVSEAELQTFYQEQIDSYTQPEERSASHILITASAQATAEELDQARAQANDIYDAIAAGSKTFQQTLEEFQAAEVEGIEVGELGTITPNMLDPAFDSTLYALLTVGDVSEPVQTPFGFHIIRLDGMTAERTKSFDEVRDDIAKQFRLQQAESRFYDLAQTLTDLSYEHPDSLEPAAQALGLTLQESDWFNRQGGKGISAYPAVVTAAFSEEVAKNGLNSEPLEVEPNHVIVVRLKEHQEATPRTLEQVRDDIVEQLRNQQAQQAIETAAGELLQRAEQGESLASLAEAFDAEVQAEQTISRTDTTPDSAIVRAAFDLPKPAEGKSSLGTAVLATSGDRALIAVSRVEPGKVEEYPADQRKALAQQLTQQRGTAQFQSLVESLRQQADIVTYNDRLL
ncbi:MAG: SurA N-terminal domain-containing protein [Candidatus Competibacteraceae bacterium]|jgi:peptidyl-prolyl cis-trans isomerase D|nr:SurA N-terminal domain-containing protein [Candidatus Competibacteraceae bacterium]